MAAQGTVQQNAKSPGLALFLSFIWCGIGQIYNGQVGKGVLLMIAYVVSILLMFAVIGFLTTPVLWIYGMVDALRSAENINRGFVGPQKRCPYCSELIQAEAVVCRHCSRDLGPPRAPLA